MKFLKPPPTRDSFASTKWKTIARFASHFPPIRCTILTVETLLEKGRKEVQHENEEREEERERGAGVEKQIRLERERAEASIWMEQHRRK